MNYKDIISAGLKESCKKHETKEEKGLVQKDDEAEDKKARKKKDDSDINAE